MMKISGLYYQAQQKKILEKIDLNFYAGKMNFILGPNGSGKSTLIKICCRQMVPSKGLIEMDGTSIDGYKIDQLSRMRAVLSQQPQLDFPLSVSEVIMMGRYPHFEFSPTKKDYDVCEEVMDLLNLELLKDFPYLKLSGGEKQRVQFARVLAQIWLHQSESNRYLFLDEPFNNLDIKYQLEFIKLLSKFIDDKTHLVATIHDLNFALQYADHIVLLQNGSIYAQGDPEDVINESSVKNVFGVDVELVDTPNSNRHVLLYK